MTDSVQTPPGPRPFGAERDPARLVAFSDAVIAIAVTLLVLEIRLPDTHHLLAGLGSLWPSYLAYLLLGPWAHSARRDRLLCGELPGLPDGGGAACT